jgi:hypothetical protein
LPTPSDPLGDGLPTFEPTAAFELRRLTTDQYVNSAQSLLQISAAGMPGIDGVTPISGLPSVGASTAVVSSGGVGRFEEAARFLARTAFSTPASRQRIVPCTPSGASDTTCFRSFVTRFGAKAFRRPLTTEEADRYATLTQALATSSNDPWDALEATTTAFLQSPHFLYLAEVGEPDPARPAKRRYSSSELASRLSYFLTNDAPDDALLAAAADGSLLTPSGLTAHANRLLASSKSRLAVRRTFASLLSLDALDFLSRPTQVFPKFTSTLGAALKEETLKSIEDVTFDRDADVRELFDSKATFVNAELAGFYGLPVPSGAGFSRVVRPDDTRVGLLGQAGVLAARDHASGTSPTTRGLFVLTRLLCQKLPLSPPAGLVIPSPPRGTLTARQRLGQHVADPTCAGCHQQMDSVGLTLERFDALGVHRATEYGLPIDDTGELGGVTYAGEAGLSGVIKNAPAATACLSQALYASSVGHLPMESDRQSFTQVNAAFDSSGARVRALLLAIAQSDGFRFPPDP